VVRVAVIGAGAQGVLAALELASAGVAVHLYEAESACLTQASRNNEGKVHLGYVYANDPTLATARLMIDGALSFEPLLRRLDVAVDEIAVSAPFQYVVARSSLLDVSAVEAHLHACHRVVQLAGQPTYFGSDLQRAPHRIPLDGYDDRAVTAAFGTPEIAVDPRSLCAVLRRRVMEDPRIEVRLSTPVDSVRRGRRGLLVDSAVGTEEYDHVVNAAWAGRLALDATLGLEPDRPWLFRWKDYLRVPGRATATPCTTIVLGPFGDIVAYPDGEYYLSWYPAGLRATTTAVAPEWPDRDDSGGLRRRLVDGLAALVPAVAGIDPEAGELEGGAIFAWGATDIDDPGSGLHQRHAVGPHTHGAYHSIDTGKLTVAPLFARTVAERVLEIGRVAG
jgi:glycine/D-amino acid oxidase-like deaminating enzyme